MAVNYNTHYYTTLTVLILTSCLFSNHGSSPTGVSVPGCGFLLLIAAPTIKKAVSFGNFESCFLLSSLFSTTWIAFHLYLFFFLFSTFCAICFHVLLSFWILSEHTQWNGLIHCGGDWKGALRHTYRITFGWHFSKTVLIKSITNIRKKMVTVLTISVWWVLLGTQETAVCLVVGLPLCIL